MKLVPNLPQDESFSSLSLGRTVSFLVSKSGRIYAFGRNLDGELGKNNLID